jgi:hypothetical protein
MSEKLREIERLILEAGRDAQRIEPHGSQWAAFVTRLDDAKVAIWHAMDNIPEGA